jgi:hypothetical protein
LILGDAIPFLDLALELFASAIDDIEIVVSQPTPLLFDVPLKLLPISLEIDSSPQLVLSLNLDRRRGVSTSDRNQSSARVTYQASIKLLGGAATVLVCWSLNYATRHA